MACPSDTRGSSREPGRVLKGRGARGPTGAALEHAHGIIFLTWLNADEAQLHFPCFHRKAALQVTLQLSFSLISVF